MSMTLLGLAAFCCNVSSSLLSDTSKVDGCSATPEPLLCVEKLALLHVFLGLLEISWPPSLLWPWQPRTLGGEPGLCDNVLALNNGVLPLHTQAASWTDTPPGLLLLHGQWCWRSWMCSLSGLCSEAGREEGGTGFCLIGLSERSLFVSPSSVRVPASSSQTCWLCLIQQLQALVRPDGKSVLEKRKCEKPRQRRSFTPS